MKYISLILLMFFPLLSISQVGESYNLNPHDSLPRCEVLFEDFEEISFKGIPKSNDLQYFTVVVHVLYDSTVTGNSPTGRISKNQVRSQINYINDFFANEGPAYHVTNTPIPIRLKLADVDPNGNPTDGIVYHNGVEIFGNPFRTYGIVPNDGSSYPNAITPQELTKPEHGITWMNIPGTDKRYFNMYVTPKIQGTSLGSGVVAFAFFPTSSRVFGAYAKAKVFGSEYYEGENDNFDLAPTLEQGKTMVHELGHNLALYHTFHNTSYPACLEGESDCTIQGDRVCDTPVHTSHSNCIDPGPCNTEISFNVMDYLHQICTYRFTQGQLDRALEYIHSTLQPYLRSMSTTPTYDCPVFQKNIGDECNDGDPLTENDRITEACDCKGVPIVFDCEEKQLNVGDTCYNEFFDTEEAVIDDNCNCIPLNTYHCCDLQANIGDDCDDGNPNTHNDVVTENCECIGELDPDIPNPVECYASIVYEYAPTGNLPIERKDSTKALGPPEINDTYNFVGLGYGGHIILGFEDAIYNGEGDDFAIVETSWGNVTYETYPESGDVFVSADGVNYYYIGEVLTKEIKYFDLTDVGLNYATHLKIVDTSPIAQGKDGFDLDGVIVVHGCIPLPFQNVMRAESEITIKPNPTSTYLTVESKIPRIVYIYDVMGRRVGKGHEIPGTIYTGELKSGIYFIGEALGKKERFILLNEAD